MEPNNAQLRGRWNAPGRSVKVNLPLILFEEDGQQIAFCPALDVCGYGDSEQEAFNAFLTSLGEFLLYTTNKGTLQEDLRKHGWIVNTAA